MSKRNRKTPQQPVQEDDEENVPGTSTQPPNKKIKIPLSQVHLEYEQEENVNHEKKVVITSKCKHCVGPKVQIFTHKICSELKRHLKYCHPDIFKKVELADMKLREEKAENQAIPKARNDQILDCINSWLLTSGMPMSTTDHPLFKKAMAMMDPNVKIPGKKGQLNYSYQKYILLNQKIKDIMARSTHIHLSMDMWTSKSSTDAYLGITVHCWDNAVKARRNFRLCLRTFNRRHTASNIIEEVTKILDEFNIRAKIRTITTDNGANIRRYDAFLFKSFNFHSFWLSKLLAFIAFGFHSFWLS